MSKVIAVFPGLGKTSLCSKYYNNDVVDRVKFTDLDYHFFKRMIGRKLQSNARTDNMYRNCLKTLKRTEISSVIFVNHLRGLEGLINHAVIPNFDRSELESRFRRRNDGRLEPGEKDIISHYDRYLRDWRNWILRNNVKFEELNSNEFLDDSSYLEKYIKSYELYESLKGGKNEPIKG